MSIHPAMKTDPFPFQEVVLASRDARLAAGHQLPLAMALLGCALGALGLLRKLTIAVIGCGSVGGRIAVLLARAGFGSLLLVDPKSYKVGSLPTHEIGPEDVGQPKAMVVARRCKAISPTSRLLAFVGPVEALELAALTDVDLVVMAPDLLAVEVELGQRCLWLGKPLVQASVHGATLTVQIRFFLNAKGAGGCPVCCYGRDEMDLMTRQVRFSCEGASDAAVPSLADAPATNSPSALCSMAADLAVIQILRFLLKLGQPVADTMLEYCGFTHRTVISPLARNPKCKLSHTPFAQVEVDVPLDSLPLTEVMQRATGVAVAPDTQFEVAGTDWVEFAACNCARPTPVRQFVARTRTKLPRCPKCSAPLVPLSFYTHRAVSAWVLGSAAERPLNRLGARHVSSVLVRSGDSGVLVRPQPSTPAAI
jgi:molybdopterin/thiamine biosynthesis adenylyltransferase